MCRGLLHDERAQLARMAYGNGPPIALESDAQKTTLLRLVAQGRVSESDYVTPEGYPTVIWSITPLGLLALRVDLPETNAVR